MHCDICKTNYYIFPADAYYSNAKKLVVKTVFCNTVKNTIILHK